MKRSTKQNTRKPHHTKRSTHGLIRMAAIAGTLCAISAFALGDEVIMRDGTVYTGDVVSQTRRSVEIETKVSGISTRLKLDRRKVKSIVIGDTQSPATTTPSTTSIPSIKGLPAVEIEETNAVLKRDGYNLVMEVPLKGGFGKEIYPGGVADSLEWAKENGVTDVVFRINSGGGALWCANDIVAIMKEHQGEFKMHMLIESAISASIWPSFMCDTITMAPGSDFGGAVGYTKNATGSAEVDLKMNSIMSAKLESTADANGHSGYLVRAMILSSASIYAHQEDGEWVFSDSTEGLPRGYETIDGPDSVLTLTAKKAIKYGIVDAMPDGKTLEEWAQVQGIEKWDSAGDVGTEIFEKAVKKSKRLEDRLNATIRGFKSEQAYLYNDQYIMQRGATLQAMRKHLGSYKRYLKEAQKLNMPSMVDGRFAEAIDVTYWESEIQTLMADLRRFRRRGP
ncbi:MAG: hypothetical protein JKX70_04780 [Phycisphaerales bacterium]|nr:hypothetical protein [Phycisphaerales bacterium]